MVTTIERSTWKQDGQRLQGESQRETVRQRGGDLKIWVCRDLAPALTDKFRQPALIVATAMIVLVVETALKTVLATIAMSTVHIDVGGVELVPVVRHFGSGTSPLH